MTGNRLEPGHDFCHRRGVLPIQRPPLENPLDALGHVQPRTTHRRVQRHDPVLEEPADEPRRLVPGQVIQHQEHPQRGQLIQECWLDAKTLLPPLPIASRRHLRRCGKRGEHGSQFLLEPAVQDGIRTGRHALDPDLAIGGMEEREELGRAVAKILVRLARRLALGLPGWAGMGNGLEWPSLVGAPDRQAQRLTGAIGVLDQLFFDSASGSVTIAVPRFRLRSADPVGHQVRLFW